MEELVSIILPIYNGEQYMDLSIESVRSQTYNNWELIIVDDCSTDNTENIAKRYTRIDSRIKYYKNKCNLKLPRNLNRGFQLAKGKFLTWTSDDNIYYPTAIEEMVNKLNETKTEFVFAECDIIDEDGKKIEVICAPRNYQQAIWGGNFVGACFLYTKSLYENIGEYDPELYLVEDYDYWLRIFAKYQVSHINHKLYGYRKHLGALSSTEKQERINTVLEKTLLKNFPETRNFTWLDKYYLYKGLNRSCELKKTVKEREKYKKKFEYYSRMYFLKITLPYKIKLLLFRKRK